MKKLISRIKQLFAHFSSGSRSERGQVLVVVTISMIGLIAFVGLTVDTGLLFLNHGKLRRSVDAAALAASSQFKEGYSAADLGKAAREFLILNGINDPTATVETCDTTPGDPDLCTTPARKLVRVTASSQMKLAFLPVIGIHEVTLSAQAVSEAASVDVVMVIDSSESMTYDAPAGDPMRDPSQCNPVNSCHPFKEVKQAAKDFVDQLYFPYDRVSIVTFDRNATNQLHLTDDELTIKSTINGLTVLSPDVCPTADGPCRAYDGFGTYLGFDCTIFHATGNPSTCTTTNIGGGLREAGNEFAIPPIRQEALWVVILLTDGAANSTHPDPYCPNYVWLNPFCRDAHTPYVRYCVDAGDTSCIAKGGVINALRYSADDYARDMVDFVAEDQRALIFSIGLGNLVQTSAPIDGGLGAGERLMDYAATTGEGTYYFAPSGNQLRAIFLDIADKIATRITK